MRKIDFQGLIQGNEIEGYVIDVCESGYVKR